MSDYSEHHWSPRRITIASIFGVAAMLVIALSPKLVEDVAGDEIAVIQSPVAGTLDFYTSPGVKWQGLGEVTKYKNRSTFEFTPTPDKKSGGIEVRFNDGGHATMYGSIQFKMPTDEKHLNLIYRTYRTQEQLQKQIIETVTIKSVYLTGTLMSSKESYGEKRNDLIHYVTDQVQNGIYKTRQVTTSVKDPITGQEKQIIAAEIVMRDGKPERQEHSVLEELGIEAFNFTIFSMPYDTAVEAQIKQQQQIAMDVQTSRAELLKAEQRALTVGEQGRADAAEAKWKQEVIKAREVTQADQQKIVAETNAQRDANVAKVNAERDAGVAKIAADRDKVVAETQAAQRLRVAELDSQAADQTKMQQIALGEGEAERKRLVIEADGALEQKLAAYTTVTPKIFEALRGTAFVPSVMMGGGNGSNDHATAMGLIDLLTAKTAKDLALDLTMSTKK